MRTFATVVFSLFTLAAVAADPIRIAGTDVRFTVTKFGFSDVTGYFRDFNADVRYDPANPERSIVEWRVRVASVQTGERNRDSALQSGDYFDAAHHPELTFTSRAVRAASNDRLEVTGDIAIRGVQKTITVPVVIGERGGRRTFVTEFTLDRYDFNVVGGAVMSRLIGRNVRVQLGAVEGGTR